MAIRNIFFDLDGTLVNSIKGIEFSCQEAVKLVLPEKRLPSLRAKIGAPIWKILNEYVPELTDEDRTKVLNHFRLIYDQEGWQKVHLYAGAEFILGQLVRNNIDCYIVTNKPLEPTCSILNYLGISQYFQEVVSPNSRIPKFNSKSESVTYLLAKHRLISEQTVLVGDSIEDYRAAKENCLKFIGVDYGYGDISLENIHDPNCLSSISHLDQVLSLIGLDLAID